MGNRNTTVISLANTRAASATWKLYPAKGVGAVDLSSHAECHRHRTQTTRYQTKTSIAHVTEHLYTSCSAAALHELQMQSRYAAT